MLSYDRTGNWPVRSLYRVFSFLSPSVAKQYISSSCAEHTCLVGVISDTILRASSNSCFAFPVESRPCRRWIMWPVSVAVESGRCLRMSSYVSPGKVAKSLGCFLIALRNVGLGGDPMVWWWYIVSSAFEVVCRVLPANCS